jgi:hypothetical protein
MAVTFTPATDVPGNVHSLGDLYALVGTFTFSGSYATGGDTLDLASIFKRTGDGRIVRVVSGVRGYDCEYNPTTKKILLYNAGAELAAAAYPAGLTASPVPVQITGK